MRVTKIVDVTGQAVDALGVRSTSFRDLEPSTTLQRALASKCSICSSHRRDQVYGVVSPKLCALTP